jgi:hypothetical protein
MPLRATPDEEFEFENKLKIKFFILEALKRGVNSNNYFAKILARISHNVPAVRDVFVAR